MAQRASAELAVCLQPGGDMRRARLLLRFAAALVVANVLHAASVLAAAQALVDAALAAAEASECVLAAGRLAVDVWETGWERADLNACKREAPGMVPCLPTPSASLLHPGRCRPLATHPPLLSHPTRTTNCTAGPTGDGGRSWQPYADHLVYIALLALPWGGPELAESVPEQLSGLLGAVDAYMAKRPRATQPSLRPFAAAIKEDDPVAE